MRKVKTIVVLSTPRTGTNHLFFLLKRIPALDVRFEIFHRQEAFGLRRAEVEALAARTGSAFASNKDPRFTEWASSHPRRLLDFLSEQSLQSDQTLMFKIFPGQLTERQIGTIVSENPDTGVIMIQRRPIDSFISLLKSSASGVFHSKDTTEIKVSASSSYFRQWWDKNYAWYAALRDIIEMHHIPCIDISYEKDISGDEAEVVAGVLHRLLAFGIDSGVPAAALLEGLPKQDRETRYENKISNWAEFQQAIEQAGYLDKAYDYFIDIPE